MKKLNILSKAEMKKVTGGDMPVNSQELVCTTPNGTESWKRPNCIEASATAECMAIYPAYGSSVTGTCVVVILP